MKLLIEIAEGIGIAAIVATLLIIGALLMAIIQTPPR